MAEKNTQNFLMSEDDVFEKVYSRIIHFISHKMRSEKEVSNKIDTYQSYYHLKPEEFNDIKEKVIKQLSERRYIGDLEYAEEYVRGTISSKKRCSRKKIKQFLYKKGISREVVINVLDLIPPDYEYNNALLDARRKLKTLFKADKYSKKAKLYSFLYQKGYSSSTISRVVDTLM